MMSNSTTGRIVFLPAIAALFLFFPAPLFAAVSIQEIMYDPPGTDDGHEWIEVYNDGASFDLSKWKLFEGGSNHGIAAYAGGATLASGARAILADNPIKFIADWPNFSGQIFDTAFSGGLNNSNGETLILRNDSLADIDSVTYSPALGATGDGNSLQKEGSSWKSSLATPGSALGVSSSGNSTSNNNDSENANGSNAQNSSGSPSSSAPAEPSPAASYPVEPQMTASAGLDRTVIAGATTIFQGHAAGLKGESLPQARFVWSFGNGDWKEGMSVLYSFPYPGKYAVVLDASSGEWSATDRIVVTAVPASISITKVTTDFIEIINRSKIELDLGMWQITADAKLFVFPANTIILPNESIEVSNVATGLLPSSPSAVRLLYPNGIPAAAYGMELIMARSSLPQPAASAAGYSPAVSYPSKGSEGHLSQGEVLGAETENNAASSTSSAPPLSNARSFGFIPWILGLLAIIGIGVAALLLTRQDAGKTAGTGYTIIEEE
jgi:hypothetical protein